MRDPWLLRGERGGVFARCTTRDVHVCAYEDGLLRVSYTAPGAPLRDASYARARSLDAMHLEGACDEHVATLIAPDLTLEIARAGGRVTVRDHAARPLLEDAPEAAPSASEVVRVTPRDELFVGLGERTGPFDRRGRRAVSWTTDAYDRSHRGFPPGADPLYLAIPSFIGVRDDAAYGLFTDVAHRLDFDLAASDPLRYAIRSAGPTIDQWLVRGPHPRDVLRRYAELTGRTPRPPRWALGFHQSRWGYRDAATLEQLADELRAHRIPSDVLWLDIQHLDGFRTFTFDAARFPDPEGLAARLHAKGFALVVIADPGLKVDPGWPVHDRAVRDGLVLRTESGAPFVANTWADASVFLDFTHPGARAMWRDEIAALARRGVDGIWLDVNEPTTFPESGAASSVPDALPIAGDGTPSTMADGHNVYALLQAGATIEGLRAARPERRPFVLTRAGFAGIQRHAAVWTGDAPSAWWSLAEVLPMLLGMSLSGVPFVGSDVGGYSGHASPELYARWLALGAVSPFFRAHQTQGPPDAHPWSFGPEVLELARAHIRERYARMPYLEALFAEHEATGAPVLRPMLYEFFEDRALRDVADQAMLGPFLLVAPITTEGATSREVRLPSGEWLELATGALFVGPATIEVDAPLATLPTFVREGAILPRVSGDVASTHELGGGLRLDLHPARTESRFTLIDDAGDGDAVSRTAISLVRDDSTVRATIDARIGDHPVAPRALELWFWRVAGEVREVRLDGRVLTADPEADAHYELDAPARAMNGGNARPQIIVRMRDPGARGALVELVT